MNVDTTLLRIFVDGNELTSTCAATDWEIVLKGIISKNRWTVRSVEEKPSVSEPEKFKNEVWVTVKEEVSATDSAQHQSS